MFSSFQGENLTFASAIESYPLQRGEPLYTSESDVSRFKSSPTERITIFIKVVDHTYYSNIYSIQIKQKELTKTFMMTSN